MPPQSLPHPSCPVTARVMGLGCYVADVPLSNPLHIQFVRSNQASGQLQPLDIAPALELPGVVAVHTHADVAHLGNLSVNPILPLTSVPNFQILADARITAVGQPIAAVLAETPKQAADGAERIWPDITPEPTAAGPAQRSPKALTQKTYSAGDMDSAFARADHIVECRIEHPRLAPSPMEPRAIAVEYAPETDGLTIWHSTQTPHRTRSELSRILDISPDRLRVIARDVGGAFGMKASLYPEEVFTVWAALHHRRATRWCATRSEDFLSATHGRGLTTAGQLALASDGRFLGLKATVEAPLGAWLPNSALVPAWNCARVLPCGYNIAHLHITTSAVQENRAPTGIYRGAGRPEAVTLMERLVDKAARAIGQDPAQLRKQNLLPANSLPHRTGTGNTLDSGDYGKALDLLTQSTGYKTLLQHRDQRRENGELVGLGLGFYLEPSGSGWETARVSLNDDGTAHVASGSSSQGHNRRRAYASIAARALDLRPEDVRVALGDTASCPAGIGALASRATAIGGSAVLKACQDIMARRNGGEQPPLSADVRYHNDGQAWGYGAYLVLLSIDRDTGTVHIEKADAIDDTGTIINAASVEGQIRGGFAQGFGEATMETLCYDTDQQLLTGSFMDYALPRARDIPDLHLATLQTPSPMNILGAKGVGEAGTIGAPVAILNAAIDALDPLGITDLQMPLTPHKVWSAIQAAKQDIPR